jgi:hypothetical protein
MQPAKLVVAVPVNVAVAVPVPLPDVSRGDDWSAPIKNCAEPYKRLHTPLAVTATVDIPAAGAAR